jgi:hypothetical protein
MKNKILTTGKFRHRPDRFFVNNRIQLALTNSSSRMQQANHYSNCRMIVNPLTYILRIDWNSTLSYMTTKKAACDYSQAAKYQEQLNFTPPVAGKQQKCLPVPASLKQGTLYSVPKQKAPWVTRGFYKFQPNQATKSA